MADDSIILQPPETHQFEPTLVEMLLKAPDHELDASMHSLIQKWSDPPKAIQLLEVIDHCIYGSLASGFILSAFQMMYTQALKNENLTHEDLIPLAIWRKE